MLELHRITAGYDRRTPVVRDASLTIGPGEAVGLLGPSGCGKSTLARVAALLHRPDSGTFRLDGTPVQRWRHRAPRDQRTAVGIVFQQPRLSADPRLRLTDLIAEPLRATGRRDLVPARVPELASTVGLTPDLLGRRPHEVSDGQLQRACLARALALRPRWLVCDEMTAMLDASTTAALVTVVEDYRRRTGAGLLSVGHDRVLLERWCDRTVEWAALSSPVSPLLPLPAEPLMPAAGHAHGDPGGEEDDRGGEARHGVGEDEREQDDDDRDRPGRRRGEGVGTQHEAEQTRG